MKICAWNKNTRLRFTQINETKKQFGIGYIHCWFGKSITNSHDGRALRHLRLDLQVDPSPANAHGTWGWGS